MSDTPRTEKNTRECHRVLGANDKVVHPDFARNLERELQEAKSKSASAYMELEKAMARMVEIKMKQASLIAAINTAITEHPSNQASIYLAGIMANLFQK